MADLKHLRELCDAATDEPVIVIETIGCQCPVQAEGTINGVPFYFRSRGGGWSLSVGRGKNIYTNPEWDFYAPFEDTNPSKLDIWDKQPEDGGVIVDHEMMGYAAGWIDESTAKTLIYTGACLYVRDRIDPQTVRALIDEIERLRGHIAKITEGVSIEAGVLTNVDIMKPKPRKCIDVDILIEAKQALKGKDDD